jgi:hypothetical protein
MRKIPERKILQIIIGRLTPGEEKRPPLEKAARTPSGKNAIKTATMTRVFHQ